MIEAYLSVRLDFRCIKHLPGRSTEVPPRHLTSMEPHVHLYPAALLVWLGQLGKRSSSCLPKGIRREVFLGPLPRVVEVIVLLPHPHEGEREVDNSSYPT